MIKTADIIDRVLKRVCEFFMWANFLLIFIIVTQVIGRYLFNWTSTALEELQWHFFAIAMMTGISYAIIENSHVRADVLFNKFSLKWQCRIEILACLLFVLPFFSFILWHSLPFVERSWAVGETSESPGGLPLRWLIKSLIPFACALINFAAISRILRAVDKMRSSHVS